MFWRQNIVAVSHIETILEKEDFELEELLEEEDILQECKTQNKKLLDYLVQPSVMDKLVTLIITEPDEQKVIKVRYKYANIACEILTFDIDVITDALISQETLLNKLYSFLETEMPLNPLLSSFFSKTMCLLLSKRNEQLVEFLKSKHNFVDLVLRHIEISAIAQLLLKFLTFATMWSGSMTWFNEQNIIQRLISLIDPTLSRDVNENAAQVLSDNIRLSREHISVMQEDAKPNPLLETIESVDVISTLVNNTFNEKRNENVIVNGISVLLALLEFKKNMFYGSQHLFNFHVFNQGLQHTNSLRTLVSMSPCNDSSDQMTTLDAERQSVSVNNTLEAIIPHLNNIHEALMDPPIKPPIKLTMGILDLPFGRSRLEISRLVAALISTNTHIVNMQFAKSGTVFALLNLFFKYKWNNFLHTQVELIIKRIILNPPTINEDGNKVHPLLDQLLSDFQMTCKILECFKEQEQNPSDAGKNGYMGHLTKIANHIAEAMDSGENSLFIENAVKNLPENHYEDWNSFINNTLSDINAKNNTPLIDMTTINAADPFAFNDKLIESDESLPEHLNLGDVSFSNEPNMFQQGIGDNILQKHLDLFQKREELFEQICQEKCHASSPTEDVDSDEDVWVKDEKEIPFIQQNCHDDEDSSDSDDEKQNLDSNKLPLPSIIKNYDIKNMDVESQNNWTSNLDNVPMDITPISTSNPWGTIEMKPSTPSGERDSWADFSNFANFSASSVECHSEIDPGTVAMDTTDGSSSKCFSSSEVDPTSNINITEEISPPPSDDLPYKSFDASSAQSEVATINSKCDKSSCNFPSVESDLSVSSMEKDNIKECDNSCSKTEATVDDQPISAIVENEPT